MTKVNADPLNVNSRLYKQVSKLLDQLENKAEELTIRERIAALVAIGRVQTIFITLRNEHRESEHAGSAVRKYADAFKAQNAGPKRKKATGRGSPTPDYAGDEPDLPDAFPNDD